MGADASATDRAIAEVGADALVCTVDEVGAEGAETGTLAPAPATGAEGGAGMEEGSIVETGAEAFAAGAFAAGACEKMIRND